MTKTTEVDVIIIGGGSAGLCAGVWLARNNISFRILERRPGRLTNGQADGVQVRTVEIFESLGISEELLKEAYHVLEDAFWAPDEDGRGIRRTHSAPDTAAGLSHMPHVILNQARINSLLTDEIDKCMENVIEYGCEVKDVEVDERDGVLVLAEKKKDGDDEGVEEVVYKAKYALAGDGAHSRARKALGIEMIGESSDEIWGVMDIYPQTTFPDIRKKCIIKSPHGNIVLIPREGDSLVRFYIELSSSSTNTTNTPSSNSTEEKAATAKSITLPHLHLKAQQILHPYPLQIPQTTWWSAYHIGQRLASTFHVHQRIFLAGDACHTHSPKAGQGMNVSLQDGYNLGWKLASVLKGDVVAEKESLLLQTYVTERQGTARDLIEFDRYFSKLFSTTTTSGGGGGGGGITPELFLKAGRYTAGLETRYKDSIITATATTTTEEGGGGGKSESGGEIVAKGLTVGMRFPGKQVIRVADARHGPLTRALLVAAHSIRWHVVVFGGRGDLERLRKLSSNLKPTIQKFTPSTSDPDSMFNIILVLSCKRADVDIEKIPDIFTPVTGKWKMKDILNVFVDDEGYNNSGHGHAYEGYGIDPVEGALVIVRPDQYVARVGSLDDVEGVDSFFRGFLTIRN
ncbi:FAD binding domain-containing protein [Poronia punctata]|nr:FAD binding domain-containing protein [Poronia punctata]